MRVEEDDGWRIPDYMWGEMKLLIPKPIDSHPLKCHKKRIGNRKVMDGFYLFSEQAANGKHWIKLIFASILLLMIDFKNGFKQVYF